VNPVTIHDRTTPAATVLPRTVPRRLQGLMLPGTPVVGGYTSDGQPAGPVFYWSDTRFPHDFESGLHHHEGVLTGDDREHAEVSMLALHLLHSSLVFINTQLLQAVLREPAWASRLTEEDRRGLSPLFWSHVNPYGRFRLDMDTRLDLSRGMSRWPYGTANGGRRRGLAAVRPVLWLAAGGGRRAGERGPGPGWCRRGAGGPGR
jgi:Tn3 transposase DDE domain